MFYSDKKKPTLITYSAEEKSRMDKIIEVFRPIMEVSHYFNIVWDDKLGYVFFDLDDTYYGDAYDAFAPQNVKTLSTLIITSIIDELSHDICDGEFSPLCEQQLYEVLVPCLEQVPEITANAEIAILMKKAMCQYHINIWDYKDGSWMELVPDRDKVRAALTGK